MLGAGYYLCMDETGKIILFELSLIHAHDPISLLQGLNRLRCHQCFTYESFNQEFMTTEPPIYPTSDLIATVVYDRYQTLKVPHLCSHNLEQVATALSLVLDILPAELKLPKLYLEKLNLTYPADTKRITEIFGTVNLSYVVDHPNDIDDFQRFLELIEACQYNFPKIQVTDYTDDEDSGYGEGFTMHQEKLYCQSLTPKILQLIDRNRKITCLVIEELDDFSSSDYKNLLTEPVKITQLQIDQLSSNNHRGASAVKFIVDFLLLFRLSLHELILGDDNSVEILHSIFTIGHAWPSLKIVNLGTKWRYDNIVLLPNNRCHFPLLTEVYFLEKDRVYEANPPLIDRLNGTTHEAYREELYFFLVYNRRNYIAAHCWDVISKNYLAKPYKISPDIRQLIFKYIIGVDTSKLGYVELPISLAEPDVFRVKSIRIIEELPNDIVYCLDRSSQRKWSRMKISRRKSDHHRRSRLKLELDLKRQQETIELIHEESEAKIKKLKAEIRTVAKSSISRLEKRGKSKRKRIDTLKGYEKKLKRSMDEILDN